MKFLIAVLYCFVVASSEDPFLEGANLCKFVECPVGTACGPTGECVPFPSEPEQDCPRVMCTLACEFGFKVKNGCPICACRRKPFKNCLFADVRCPVGEECDPFSGLCVPKCPTIRCMLACEHGFKIVNGCPICACERESFKFLAEESKEV
uniref:Antistasin-like factor A n=1 Tax=Hirudo verbana TaxID=311461 RepID=A0A7T0KAU5_9ANNE|nr:antistasin-like factor A [Hirudo verbana]